MIPENKHFLTGFRIVQAEMPIYEALGMGDNNNGYTPLSISKDNGKSWIYSASQFPLIGGSSVREESGHLWQKRI